MLQDFFLSLVLALSLGVLIGSERERIQRKNGYEDFAGIRTFALISVFGFLSNYVDGYVPHFFIVSFAAIFLFIMGTYAYNSFAKGFSGITTEISAILTFVVGFLAYRHVEQAVIIGILLPLVMSLKQVSHRLMEKISDTEFFSTLKFCIVAFVVLPLLPDRTVDPWHLVNPFKLWQTVVFISGVSFLGYILIKVLGINRGSRFTGLFGGVASSTAVTVSFGQQSREHADDRPATMSLVAGLLLAVATSFIRIVAVTWITNKEVALAFLPNIAAVAATILASSFLLGRLIPQKPALVKSIGLQSPFSLWKASQFALLLMAIILVSEIATHYFGAKGIYVASVLSGVAKGDGIAVVVAAMVARGTLDVATAVQAILVSVGTSFVSKTVLARVSGTRQYSLGFGLAMVLPFLAVLASIFLM